MVLLVLVLVMAYEAARQGDPEPPARPQEQALQPERPSCSYRT